MLEDGAGEAEGEPRPFRKATVSVDPPAGGRARFGSTRSRSRRSPGALAELLAERKPQPPRARLISAEAVAERWGVSRRWVYEHAERSARAGSGPAAGRACASTPTRSPSNSASRRAKAPPGEMRGDPRGCAAIAVLTRFPGEAELWSVGKQENGRGGARTPPGPAPKEGLGAMRSLAPPGHLAADPPPAAGRRGGQ